VLRLLSGLITDEGCKLLAAMPLDEVSVGSKQITDRGVQYFIDSANIPRIHLRGSGITDEMVGRARRSGIDIDNK
jgi:hypothetical protein